ncbi:hypothetical protein CYR55_08350 [Chimaeribacter californicus]|uniref:Uncharacterized protein n=2 Tax=Chimaeribacter californicus TaxID=2060067 RepID=A0A2N5EA22_9GAMM|nr:hypothetical protein CYR55_08350 [Chimaeribacter californicus]
MTSTIGYPILWEVGIPISVAAVCYSCSKISGFRPTVVPFAFALILFATMPYQINIDASWWITGFYNYLLPTAVALYVFSVCYSGEGGSFKKIVCALLCFYFPYMEQAGLAFVVAMIFFICYQGRMLSRFNLVITLLVIINLIICLKAPGNEKRFALEVWRWYPQYQTYGLINKLSLGFDKLHQLMTFRYNIPLIALMISAFYVRCSYSGMRNSTKCALFIIATFISISIANSLTGLFSGGFIFNSATVDATRWSAGKVYISYFYIFAVISSLFLVLIDLVMNAKSNCTPIIAMLIGFMTVTMLGLSPTVYASGYRVDFIFEIMCIISCMSIISSSANGK